MVSAVRRSPLVRGRGAPGGVSAVVYLMVGRFLGRRRGERMPHIAKGPCFVGRLSPCAPPSSTGLLAAAASAPARPSRLRPPARQNAFGTAGPPRGARLRG